MACPYISSAGRTSHGEPRAPPGPPYLGFVGGAPQNIVALGLYILSLSCYVCFEFWGFSRQPHYVRQHG